MKQGLCFKDVMMIPQYSSVRSRHDVDISTKLGKYKFKVPIIAANMDRICESSMAIAMNKIGGIGVIHRFNSINQQYEEAKKVRLYQQDAPIAIALGLNDLEERANKLSFTANMFVIDVAHGHCQRVIEAIKYLKETYPSHYLIAGNVATNAGAMDLIASGADCIKIGISPGAVCKTKSTTGHGIPQLTAILDCSSPDYSTIADGGIACSGDIVKALGAGATMVMLGYLLAGTEETPGRTFTREDGSKYKYYRGMSSREASNREDVASEGISIEVPYKGSVEGVINDLVMGLRSGMSYSGAKNLQELYDKAEFIQLQD